VQCSIVYKSGQWQYDIEPRCEVSVMELDGLMIPTVAVHVEVRL
jgi:hypothetical protein